MTDFLRLSFRLWARETSRITGIRRSHAIAGGIFALGILAIVGYGTLSAFSGFTADLEGRTSEELSLILVSLGNSFLLTSLVIGAVFGLLTADPTAMDNVLHIGGANRVQRLAIGLVPSVVVSVAVSLALAIPLLAPIPMVTTQFSTGLALVIAGAVLAASGAVLSFGFHRIVAIMARHQLRLPVLHANALAALITIGISIVICAPGFQPGLSDRAVYQWLPPQSLTSIYVGLSTSDVTGIAAGVLSLTLLVAAAGFVLYAAASTLRDLRSHSALRTFHSFQIFGSSRFTATVWYEMISLVRAPTTLLSVMGTVGLSVVAIAVRDQSFGPLIALLPGAIAGAIGMQSVGLNLPSAWTLWAINGKDSSWGWSKVVATAAVSIGVYSTVAVPLILAFGIEMYIGGAYMTLLPVFASSLLAGAIVPVSSEQPVSSAMAGALTFFVGAVGLLSVDRLLGLLGATISPFAVPVFVALCVAGFLVVTARMTTEATVNLA